MATIRKRSGKYQVQVRREGKTLTKTFTTKNDALKWAKEIEVQIEQGNFKPKRERIRLDQLLDRWEKEVLIYLKSWCVEKYKVQLVKKALGNLYIDEITSTRLAAYRDQRLSTASNQTTKHELALVRRALKKSIEWGYLDSVPYVASPSLKGQARSRRLTREQLNKLIESADSYMCHVIIILVETAMRRGELAKIKLSDIDLDNRLITLRDTKNGTDRVVPLSNKAVISVKYLVEAAESDLLLNYKKDFLTRHFKKLCESAGFYDFRLHDLRHEGVTALFEKGLNMVEVSVISGHKDLAMLKRYTHINPKTLLDRL